jgi:hypothetical protein
MRRNVTEFKDIHKGKDMWVICGGASMDYVQPSFFDGKITMAIGEAFRKYKNMTYYLRKDGRAYQGFDIFDDVIKNSPDSKIIFSDYHGCAYEWGKNEWTDEEAPIDYWYFEHEPTHGELPANWNEIEGKFAACISNAAIATHLCAYMGAKNIIIGGNDTVFFDGKDYFKEYGVYDCPTSHIHTLNWGYGQTLEVVKYFRAKGINIIGLNPFVDLRLEGHYTTIKNPDGR